MQNKSQSLKSVEKRFRAFCVDRGCVVSGDAPQLHHLYGSSAKVKVGFETIHIGEIAIIPLSPWWHMDGKNPACVDLWPRDFERITGKTEKEFWLEVALDFGGFTDDQINAVMNYSKLNRRFGFDLDQYRLTSELPDLLVVA